MDMSGRWYLSHKWLRWIARACLFSSAVSVSIVSYYFYAPDYHPFSGLEPQIGQPLLYGGFLSAIAGFAWFWPAPGGVIALMYGGFRLLQGLSGLLLTLTPLPVYLVLYGVFVIGGILHLAAGLGQTKATRISYPDDKWIRWTARILTLGSIVIFVIIYTLVYPKWWVFGIIPALITAGIAWFWPAPGGLLMLLFGIPAFYNLFETNYDFQLKLPAYILCLVFIASGVLHLIWWRRRKRRA